MRQFTCPKAVTHPSTNRARCRATACVDRDQRVTATPNRQPNLFKLPVCNCRHVTCQDRDLQMYDATFIRVRNTELTYSVAWRLQLSPTQRRYQQPKCTDENSPLALPLHRVELLARHPSDPKLQRPRYYKRDGLHMIINHILTTY